LARIRPVHALPLLERRRVELETCAFCPKLCRSACPVSNAEPRETLTPWGKMSAAWMSARADRGEAPAGGVRTAAPQPAPAWACTECFACTEACAHRNPAGEVLVEARSASAKDGSTPEAAKRILARFASHEDDTRAVARALAPARVGVESADTVLYVGCGYLLKAPAEARDALAAGQALAGGAIHVAQRCCGLPLRLAGDAARFDQHARAVAGELARYRRILVVDPGCALTLRRHYPRESTSEAPVGERVELLVEAAARRAGDLGRIRDASGEPVRWHDPCQLGRGLGVYEAPRLVLARATGAPVAELRDSRGAAVCSGAGGLVPSTMPGVAQTMAEARLAEHQAAGGGRVVTGCASSLTALRKYGARLGVPVDDLVTYIARSLKAGRA
jgi:Fe-S oxidoreductase